MTEFRTFYEFINIEFKIILKIKCLNSKYTIIQFVKKLSSNLSEVEQSIRFNFVTKYIT